MTTIEFTTCKGEKIRYNHTRAMLFDMDGTLIDTLDLHITSFKAILEKYGAEVTKEELASLMGRTPQDILAIYLKNKSADEIWEIAIEKEEYLYRLIPKAEAIKVNSGVFELLEELGRRNIPRVVISSTHRSLVNRLLSNVGLTDYLDEMVPGDEVTRGKPDPEPFLKGLAKTGRLKDEVIGMGDSIFDYQSCTTAGMRFIGVTLGKTSCEKFAHNSVGSVIDSFEEIRVVD